MDRRTPAVFRSLLAARAVVAFSQQPSAVTQRELARALAVRDSSLQRALTSLRGAGLVTRSARGYAVDTRHAALREVFAVALIDIPRRQALTDLVQANAGVEFASLAEPVLRVVYRNSADAATQLRLEDTVDLVRPAVQLESFVHDALVRALLDRPELRDTFSAGAVLKGSVARSLPDRRRHGDFVKARVLGRPNAKLTLPSGRALRGIAQRYRLAHLGLFGSAVREDLRPDSDVDVLIRFRPDARAGYGTLTALRDELEALFDRDVDLVEAQRLSPDAVPNVEREEVTLVGRP